MQASTNALKTILSQHKATHVNADQRIWTPHVSEGRAKQGEPTVAFLCAMFDTMKLSSESRSMGTVKTRTDVNRAVDQCPLSTHKVAVSMVLLDLVQRMDGEQLLSLTDSLGLVDQEPVRYNVPAKRQEASWSLKPRCEPGAQDAFFARRPTAHSKQPEPLVVDEDELHEFRAGQDVKQREVKTRETAVCLCGAHARQARTSGLASVDLQTLEAFSREGASCMAKTKAGKPCQSKIAVGKVVFHD